MPGLFDRVARLARSPKGQQVIAQATAKAQQLAKDPKNAARVQRLREEVTRRMGQQAGGRSRPPAGGPPPAGGRPPAAGGQPPAAS